MTKLDEIRATNEKRLQYEEAARCFDCETAEFEQKPAAAHDITYLISLLDKRTEALVRIGRMDSCVEFDCGVAIHAAARIAREALADDATVAAKEE